MSKRAISILSILLLVVLAGLLLASCGSISSSATSAPTSSGNTGNPADGQTLMQQRCSVCHSLSRIEAAHKTTDQWKTTVERMISNGAQLTQQEEQVLVDYLAQNFQ